MTSIQGFFPASFKVESNQVIGVPDIFPKFKIVQVTWSRLLGKDNKEITISSLSNSPKFISFVQTAREDLKADPNNLKKFPKMSDIDW